MDRFLRTDARQILLDSGAFKLAPDGHLIEIDDDPEDPEEEKSFGELESLILS